MKKLRFALGTALIALCVAGSAFCIYAQTKTAAATDAKAEIEALETRYNDGFNSKNINKIMSCYAPGKGLFVFDAVPPREYPSWDAYKRDWESLFAAYPGPASNAISEQSLTVVGSVAYGHDIQAASFTRKDGSRVNVTVRVTDVYRKMKTGWLIVQEHVSVPVDIDTAKADLSSKK